MFGVRLLIFASLNFFFFLVRRNSANFASARLRKSFAGCRLVCGGEAKLSEFRLGGCAKFSPGEALFVWHIEDRISCAKLFGVGIAHV